MKDETPPDTRTTEITSITTEIGSPTCQIPTAHRVDEATISQLLTLRNEANEANEAKMASKVKPAQSIPPSNSNQPTASTATKDTPNPGCGPQDSAEDSTLYTRPTKEQWEKAFKLDVLDKDGNKHNFGELCHDGSEGVERNLVIFIRHWFCGVCPPSSPVPIHLPSNESNC